MATEWISPTWRMPNDKNQSKFENYSLDFDSGFPWLELESAADPLPIFTPQDKKFSVSMWIKPDDATPAANEYLYYIMSAGGAGKIGFWLDTTGKINWRVYSGSPQKTITSTATLSDNTWYHIVGTWDGSTINLYINGASAATPVAATDAYTATAGNTWATFGIYRFGSTGASKGGYFTGEAGQLAIWNNIALDESQISYLYNSGTSQNPMAISGQPPVAYYPLGGSSTGSASTLTVPNESVADATVFDFPSGGADLINCGNKVDFTNAFTLSSWVKTDTTSASFIFYKNATFTVGKDTWYDGGVGNRARVTLTDSNGLSKDFRSNVAPAGATVTVGTVVDLKDGNWHQIVFSYDGVNQGKLYTDGALTYTYDITDGAWAGSLANNTNDLVLGSNVTVQTWTGGMSNTQIWETVLTGTDVTTLYNNGVPLLSGTQPQAANLKAWYPMNVGNANWLGSDWQIADANSAYPQSFDFDGSSDEIVVSNDAALQIDGDITISAWVYAESDTGRVVSKRGGGGTNYDFYIESRYLRLYDGGTGPFSTGRITLNQWTHILISVTSGTGTYYIDNVAAGTGSFSISSVGTSQPFFIGGAYTPVLANFDGKMSNVQIWNAGLDASQVETLYNNGSPLTTAIASSNLKAWYKLNNNEIWDGTNWEVENQGYPANYESALDFDGTNDWIDCGAGFQYSDLTISGWFYADSISTFERIIQLGRSSGGIGFGVGWDNSSKLIAWWNDGTETVRLGNTSLSTGNWYHFAMTRDSSEVKIYVNGVDDSGTGGQTGWGSTNNNLELGRKAGGGQYMDGKLSNVAIFNTTLDSSAITALYNNGTPETSISSSPVSWWKLDNLTTGIQDSVGSNNGTNNGATKVNTFVSTQVGVSSGMTESNLVDNNVSALNGTSSGMTTANLVNSDLTRSIPYSSYSMSFDAASSERVDITGLPDFGGGSLSTSFWIKSGVDASNAYVLSRGGFSFYIYQNGTNPSLRYRVQTSALNTIDGGTTLDNNWHHCVMTFDSAANEFKVFEDGVQVSSTVTTSGSLASSTSTVYLASFAAGAPFKGGNFSNLAIWNTALTEDQILTIYNGGVPNSVSSLSPVGWWSLGGDSYYDGTNFILPDLSANSNNGTSANMSGIELVGNGPGSSANGTATSMDIPTNLKGDAPNSSSNAFSVNMNSADRVADVPA